MQQLGQPVDLKLCEDDVFLRLSGILLVSINKPGRSTHPITSPSARGDHFPCFTYASPFHHGPV